MERKSILAIRIRGQINVPNRIKDTLKMLRIDRNNYASLLDDRPDYKGMLQKAKDYITWGEVSEDVIMRLLTKRGRLPGNVRLTDSYVKKNSKYTGIKALAKAIASGKASVKDVEGLKPIFRLTPPSKGFKGKKYYGVGMGGITGYRGEDINSLALRMI